MCIKINYFFSQLDTLLFLISDNKAFQSNLIVGREFRPCLKNFPNTYLEMYMREKNQPICGRDHLSYRSYYSPVKHVIECDLCEQTGAEKRERISEELDRTPADVLKKLEDIRTRYVFSFWIIFCTVYQTMTDMCIKINYFFLTWISCVVFNFRQ